jgi:ribosomal-protein-alanine N-acetyltransferase
VSRATGVQLIEMSLGTLAAEDASVSDLGALLGVDVPAGWPPLYHDAGVRGWFGAQLAANDAAARWLGRYVVATIDGNPTLVGTAGYKGAPDAAGAVEIGYSIVQAYHRRGIGLETVRQLIDDAFADPRVRSISAETPVTFVASRGLLERSGFALTGTRSDAEDGELAIYSIARS